MEIEPMRRKDEINDSFTTERLLVSRLQARGGGDGGDRNEKKKREN